MPDHQQSVQPQNKRTGHDRRQEARPPRNGIERRNSPERRQTSVSEISYFEWALQYVKFHGRALTTAQSGDVQTPEADDRG